MQTEFDTIIIGGGLVGAAVACGISGRGNSVAVLDGDDGDFRASKGNFVLARIQGKGADTVAWIIATERGETMSETGRFRVRSPLKPITLGQISSTI